MKLPSLRGILAGLRKQPTPSWALPTCPQCRISMKPNGEGQTYVCPKCKLRLWSGKTVGELPNQGEHHGDL